MPIKKMLLFDWNGTLIDDMDFWRKSVAKVFEAQGIKFSPRLFEEFVEKLGAAGSATKAYELMGITMPKEKTRETYRNEYRTHLEGVQLSRGAREVLSALKSQGLIMGIVTAQYGQLFDPIFSRLELKPYFRHVVTDAKTKDTAISHLCFLEHICHKNCYYVGDMPSDIRQARRAGARPIAYLTRHIKKEVMLQAKPDFPISSLEELPEITGRKKK